MCKKETPSATADNILLNKFCQDHLQKRCSNKRLSRLVVQRILDFFPPGTISAASLQRMAECGAFMAWVTSSDGSLRSLLSARFCGKRLCPICMVRRARREAIIFDELCRAAEEDCEDNYLPVLATTPLLPLPEKQFVFAEKPAYIFVFLTLTAQSPELPDLRYFIDRMCEGHRWLVSMPWWQDTVCGYIRKLGVTINEETLLPHPHFHYVLAVRPSYLTAKNYPLTLSKIRDVWELVMSGSQGSVFDLSGGLARVCDSERHYTVDHRYGVNLTLCSWDEIFRKTLRKARQEKVSDPFAVAEAAAAEAMRDFYADRNGAASFYNGELPLDRHCKAHLPRELAQYAVQMMEVSEKALTGEVLYGLFKGLKDIKFTTYGGIFRQLRRRQLAGKLILKPFEGETVKFRYLENFSRFDGKKYHPEYIDLGDEYEAREAKILASSILSEKAEEQFFGGDYRSEVSVDKITFQPPSGEEVELVSVSKTEKVDDEERNELVGASKAAAYYCALAEKQSKKIPRLSYYQRLRLLKYCAESGVDPWDFEANVREKYGVEKLFTTTMLVNAESDFPDEAAKWKFFRQRKDFLKRT